MYFFADPDPAMLTNADRTIKLLAILFWTIVQRRVDGVHVDSDEKMDSLQLEYTYLLTSQVNAHG